MALLRILCLPSTTHLFTQRHSHLTSFSSLHSHSITNLSFCHPPSSFHLLLRLSLAHTPILVRTKQTANFTLKFASTSQQQLALDDSSRTDVSAGGQVTEAATEEFSHTRLLAQNVPWTSTPEDIRSLFERHGKVLEVELSMYNKTRNRGLAFVEMGSPEEALAALKNLESYEFEGRIIKLSYARPKKKRTLPPVPPKPIVFDLFVANLSYEARSKDLKEFFDSGSGSGSVVSAEVIFHDNPRRSSGYGFLSFKSKKQADVALSEFQGKIFMGRPIRVARSKKFVKQRVEESAKSEDASSELSVNGTEADKAD